MNGGSGGGGCGGAGTISILGGAVGTVIGHGGSGGGGGGMLRTGKPRSPVAGDSYYDLNDDTLRIYDGKQWNVMLSSAHSTMLEDITGTFTPNMIKPTSISGPATSAEEAARYPFFCMECQRSYVSPQHDCENLVMRATAAVMIHGQRLIGTER